MTTRDMKTLGEDGARLRLTQVAFHNILVLAVWAKALIPAGPTWF
ncbi:unnamed protein product, partial [marine sediment metagenome]